jgi:hypothetical protein
LAKVKQINYGGAEASYWASQSVDFDAVVADNGGLLGCSRLTLKFNRLQPAGVTEDQVMTHFWFAKIAGTDYAYVPVVELATIEPLVDTWFTAVKPFVHSDFTLVEYAWHQFTENSPPSMDKNGVRRGQKPGPAVRTTAKSVVGTFSGTGLPHQVACNVTMRTCSRRHWGRSAIPGMGSGSLQGQYGRFSSTTVDAIANATNVLHDSAQTATYQVGVWSQLHPAFMTPKTIEVDDVPDIQRRRRAKRTAYRKLLS